MNYFRYLLCFLLGGGYASMFWGCSLWGYGEYAGLWMIPSLTTFAVLGLLVAALCDDTQKKGTL